jgi:hypothetical protein
LINASSALRCWVSSTSPAFPSATLRLAVDVLERDHADRLVAADHGHPDPRLRGLAGQDLGIAVLLAFGDQVFVEQQRLARLDHVPPEADQRHRLVRVSNAELDRVGEVQDAGHLVVDADVDDLGVEDLLELVAQSVVDGLSVELPGDRRLHAVDECELGVPLPRLLDRAGAGEGRAHVLADEGEELLVLARVLDLLRVRLHNEGSDRSTLVLERDAQPARVLGEHADELDLALLDQFVVALVREQLRLSRAEQVAGRPTRLVAAELDPLVRLGPVVVELVRPVRPVDQLPVLVVERDVEVVRMHQLADHRVYRSVELLHVASRARELGDSIERALHGLLRAEAFGLGGLELGQPAARVGEV